MKKAVVVAALAFVVALQFSCTTGESKPPMKTFKEKYSYMRGLDIGHTFKQMNTDIDYNALTWGIKEITQKRPPLLTTKELDSVKQEFSMMMQQAQAPMMKEAGDKNQKEGDTFTVKKFKTVKDSDGSSKSIEMQKRVRPLEQRPKGLWPSLHRLPLRV